MSERTFRRELSGGGRLVGESVPGRRSVALGVWLGVGGRDEDAGLEGAAHFLEHLVFKGTTTRSSKEIAESLERVGGSLDAFTTKENTCFYARVLEEDLELAVDVLADLVTNPIFEPEQIDLERRVVIEEIRSAEDNPEDLIGDLAHRHLFPGHPLGESILGTPESLERLTQTSVRSHYAKRYRAGDLVISAAGAIDEDRLTGLLESRIHLAPGQGSAGRVPPPNADTVLAVHQSDLSQLQLLLSAPAPGETHPDRPALQLLTDILGGGMSSRLFQSVREDAGLAYNVQAYSEQFEDVGLASIYLAVSPERGREAVERTLDEVRKLLRDGLLEGELSAAKAQVRGGMIMGQESLTTRMSRLARIEYSKGHLEDLTSSLREFEAVSQADVERVARLYLDPGRLSLVAMGPIDAKDLACKEFARTLELEAV